MTTDHFSILRKTIDELSQEQSYKSVCHPHFKDHKMPSISALEDVVNLSREVIFPGYYGDSSIRPESVSYYIGVNTEKLYTLLVDQIFAGLCFMCDNPEGFDLNEQKSQAHDYASSFISRLPEIRRVLATDVEAAFLGDPAAKSKGEVIFCYPAIRAITNYRVANALLEIGVPLIPRMISEMAHSETGIDIHPRATIGEYFSIDHGTGVVIGATSIIGNNVKLFQGVTLGAKSFPLDSDGNPIKGIPRHPIIEDNVVIYAQATILGRITVGANSIIGGNVWVTNSVVPYSKVVQFKPRDVLYAEGGGI
ncbi:serine O-acetyltransferase [Carboxylicivirga sp. M1479]|uniref:serine O-acetyltransferase n=1 Tax=Carboxylicivirga sp. M1479 TaxID=2594476 RepID=UPI001177E4E2|nr:serine acetyltransferase [Carboxylicivirga sp. M1479]TRX70670.1 serine acetyltransferase [Carboxylicivirga sp. M1479]